MTYLIHNTHTWLATNIHTSHARIHTRMYKCTNTFYFFTDLYKIVYILCYSTKLNVFESLYFLFFASYSLRFLIFIFMLSFVSSSHLQLTNLLAYFSIFYNFFNSFLLCIKYFFVT